MNYKEKFISHINEYKKVQKELKLENEKFNQDTTRSDDEINENIERLEELHQEELIKLRANVEKAIADKKEELGDPIEPNLDKDYQLRLKNLLIVFKRSGTDMSNENIIKGIVLFTEDPIALDPLRVALIESGRKKGEVEELIPLDLSDITRAKLYGIEKSLDDKLKISLTVDTEDCLGYEPLLNVLDGDFNYIG